MRCCWGAPRFQKIRGVVFSLWLKGSMRAGPVGQGLGTEKMTPRKIVSPSATIVHMASNRAPTSCIRVSPPVSAIRTASCLNSDECFGPIVVLLLRIICGKRNGTIPRQFQSVIGPCSAVVACIARPKTAKPLKNSPSARDLEKLGLILSPVQSGRSGRLSI